MKRLLIVADVPSENTRALAEALAASGRDERVNGVGVICREPLDGFVAGYSRYVTDTDLAALPSACREQPWVRTISSGDLLAYYRVVARYASGDLFATGALLSEPCRPESRRSPSS